MRTEAPVFPLKFELLMGSLQVDLGEVPASMTSGGQTVVPIHGFFWYKLGDPLDGEQA